MSMRFLFSPLVNFNNSMRLVYSQTLKNSLRIGILHMSYNSKTHMKCGQSRNAAVSRIKMVCRVDAQTDELSNIVALFGKFETTCSDMPTTKSHLHDMDLETIERRADTICRIREDIKSKCEYTAGVDIYAIKKSYYVNCITNARSYSKKTMMRVKIITANSNRRNRVKTYSRECPSWIFTTILALF